MRWSLRYQILLPVAAVMLGTLVGVSLLNAYLSVRNTRTQIHQQLRNVAGTLSQGNFPLTDAVLQQTRGLSGAEFVVTDQAGNVVSSSRTGMLLPALALSPQSGEQLVLGDIVQVGSESYFYAVVGLPRRSEIVQSQLLHIFYPEESYQSALWNAVFPPLIVGGVSLILVVFLAMMIAARVTRPLGQLRGQVDRIAQGEFEPIRLPDRNDEILDLGLSVNRMAEMLAGYEEKVRQNERLRTLGQLSGSMAHQLRNAVTGCQMALELHDRKCIVKNETLDVARRQLVLMERYLKQFFSRGDHLTEPYCPVDLTLVVENVLKLVSPNAEHAGIELQFIAPEERLLVEGDTDGLEQLVINLLQNAIEAAALPRDEKQKMNQVFGKVIIRIMTDSKNHVILNIQDSGCGPAEELKESMFEPLVTGRIDGTGLGLSVAREIVRQHRGEIRWKRKDNMTHFIVEFPHPHREMQ